MLKNFPRAKHKNHNWKGWIRHWKFHLLDYMIMYKISVGLFCFWKFSYFLEKFNALNFFQIFLSDLLSQKGDFKPKWICHYQIYSFYFTVAVRQDAPWSYRMERTLSLIFSKKHIIADWKQLKSRVGKQYDKDLAFSPQLMTLKIKLQFSTFDFPSKLVFSFGFLNWNGEWLIWRALSFLLNCKKRIYLQITMCEN